MAGKGGRHVFDAIGMTRVVIEDGEVIEVGQPELKYCPLFKKLVGMEDISPEKIRENMDGQSAMERFGTITIDNQNNKLIIKH